MSDEIDRAQWRTIIEALGVESPSDELRMDIANLYQTAKQLTTARAEREAPQSRRDYQAKVAKAAGKLRQLLEDAPEHAITELYDEGLRHAVPRDNPPPLTQGIHELTEQVREIEVFADIVASTPRRRSEKQKHAFAGLAVELFAKHCPQGSREDVQAFAEGVWQAASPGDEASLERQIKEAWSVTTPA